MTMMGLDTDILELLDFEYEEPCFNHDLEDVLCKEPAVFRCMLSCCGEIVLYCTECLAYIKMWLHRHTGRDFQCSFCDEVVVLDITHVSVLGRIKS